MGCDYMNFLALESFHFANPRSVWGGRVVQVVRWSSVNVQCQGVLQIG